MTAKYTAMPAAAPSARRDLGPEGGDAGGRIVATGTPEQVAEVPGSYTDAYLTRVLAARLEDAKRRA